MPADIAAGIDRTIRTRPPQDGSELVGWVAVVEWRTPDGERRFERFGEPVGNRTQLKGYLHGALYRSATTGFDERQQTG
jgi:hypothetical protein